MREKYAKIEKRALKDFPYTAFIWRIHLTAPLLQTNEGSLSLQTWPEGSLSCISNVFGINTKSAG